MESATAKTEAAERVNHSPPSDHDPTGGSSARCGTARKSLITDEPWDCYFFNQEPVWFSSDPVATGSNPRLDIDDTNGLGPENTNIDDPEPGTYRIAVHYWRGSAPTRNTVRVFLNGLQVAEYRRTLNDQQKWLVADIKWGEGGTGTLTPYPSDVNGQIGTLSDFPTSSCGAFGY